MTRSQSSLRCLPRGSLALSLVFLVAGAGPAQDEGPPEGVKNEHRRDVMGLSPGLTGEPLREAAREAYQRGFDFLVACQNKDGSFGSHDPSMAFLKDFGFQTANRGSQDGVRMACTAIIGKALLGKPERSEAEEACLQRLTEALLDESRFAYHQGEAFNTWGYGYKLDFLCDLLELAPKRAEREQIQVSATVCIEGLQRFQQADGGWNYYAGTVMGSESMLFNTANFAEALERARRLELGASRLLVQDAARLLRRGRTIRGGVVYDARFLHSAQAVNELSSASRTAAWMEAMAELGEVGEAELLQCLRTFDEGENWLEHGRKLIQPHSAVHQVSGYFFFYGYHYLSEVMQRLGTKAPWRRWERSAWTMLRTQEKDGCWWDTPAADYGDKWGTGFALLTLQRFLEATPPAQKEDSGSDTGGSKDDH